MKNMKQHAPEVSRRRVFGTAPSQGWGSALPILALCACVLWAQDATALGLRIPNQDASAIARGNAFVATADNPSAMYYNPAGITQLEGQHIQAGSLFYLGIYADYESPTGASVHNNAEVIAAPTLQYTISPEDLPLSFGFGVYEPFGFSVKWPNEAPFRQEALEGSLAYVTLNPVVAWRIVPSLSIAAGPTFNYSQITMKQGILPSPYLLPGDEAKFKGDNWSYGFNVGLLWQPHPQWSFGASYRSSSRMDYQGDFTMQPSPPLVPGSIATSSSIDFPQIAIAGISFRPTPKWNIEFDLDWADWDSVDSLAIQGVSNRRLDWHSTFMYEFGVTRSFDNGYYLSAGYFYSPASTSTEFFTPLVADTDLHVGSLGGGYKGHHWDWAVAFQLIAGGWRSVTVNPSISSSVNGQYRLLTPTLSFSVGYHF
jgi:long-chain fatty acid transport protein